MESQTLWLTLRLAALTTALLLLVCLPVAWWIAAAPKTGNARTGRVLVQAAAGLPLVLPPTVIGYYLLVGLGPLTVMGRGLTRLLGHPLAFSFGGLLVGSMIYSLPFAMQPLVAGFQAMEQGYVETARGLGAGSWQVLAGVVLPMVRPSIITSAVLTFTHTVGEFGVVLMVGGNLPGVTRTMSIALYDQVQDGRYAEANYTALILIVLSLMALVVVYLRPSAMARAPRG